MIVAAQQKKLNMSKQRLRSVSKSSSISRAKSKLSSQNFSIKSLPKLSSEDIRYLKEDYLSLKNVKLRKVVSRDAIPPQTPNSEFEFQETFKPIPPFPNLDNLEIPYVREKGVRYCINHFADFFYCSDYKTNYLHFWFLDVLTDCVWCLQDEYLLPIPLQKIAMDWFLFFVELIRNPQYNLSRKTFFTIFKEAILIAAEVVDEGSVSVPSPKQVFQLMEDQEQSEIDPSDLASSVSSIAVNQSDYENVSCIDIEKENGPYRLQLPPESCQCDEFDLSTIYTLTESDSKFSYDKSSTFVDKEGHINDDMSFYKPDFDIPSRFLETFNETDEEEVEEEEEEEERDKPNIQSSSSNSTENAENFKIYEVEDKFGIVTESCVPSENSINNTQLSKESFLKDLQNVPNNDKQDDAKIMSDQDILKALTVQKLWEQRLVDMSNPCKGWIPCKSDMEVAEDDVKQEEEKEQDKDEWIDIVEHGRNKETQLFQDTSVLNFGVLWAIIEIVFKYFYESFQFSLVKMAFHATPEVISQKLNSAWNIVKVNKVRLVKPKYQLPKSKLKKNVKSKKGSKKSDKGSKKSKKGSKKSDKGSKKLDKESKKNTKKKEKSQRAKSPKKPKLTAAEKKALAAELAKQRLEERLLEEELRKTEENKVYLFPLMEGATDDFFREIFPNWTKPKDKPAKKSKKKNPKKKKK